MILMFGNSPEAISVFYQNHNTINPKIQFVVKYIIEERDGGPGHLPLSDESYVPIKDAMIILIDDRSGKINKSGITDERGMWETSIKVNRDPRFKEREMGTITTITVADGYNETIHFNVPVNEYGENYLSRDFIILRPIKPQERNEPTFKNASFHRFSVFEMLDYYAGELGLKRQPIVSETQIPPWSPNKK